MSPSRLVADVVLLCVLTQFHTDSIARNCGLSSRMTIFVYITIYICPDGDNIVECSLDTSARESVVTILTANPSNNIILEIANLQARLRE